MLKSDVSIEPRVPGCLEHNPFTFSQTRSEYTSSVLAHKTPDRLENYWFMHLKTPQGEAGQGVGICLNISVGVIFQSNVSRGPLIDSPLLLSNLPVFLLIIVWKF